MKSEHRHELAENDLSKLLEKGRDEIEPHLNKVIIGVLVAAVVIVGGIAVYRSQGATDTRGATELAAASTAAEYEKVANDFEGTTSGLWARLRSGEEYLREGIRLSLTNRSASNESLEAAQQAFEQVLRADGLMSEMRERALYGLALVTESQTSEQTTTRPAIEAYEQLIAAFPDSRYKGQAEARIEALQDPAAGEFYAWFHAQNPKPEDRPRPMDSRGGLPFGGSGNPFLDSEPPAEFPEGVTPPGPSETEPAESTETPADSSATDESPESSASDTEEPKGPELP